MSTCHYSLLIIILTCRKLLIFLRSDRLFETIVVNKQHPFELIVRNTCGYKNLASTVHVCRRLQLLGDGQTIDERLEPAQAFDVARILLTMSCYQRDDPGPVNLISPIHVVTICSHSSKIVRYLTGEGILYITCYAGQTEKGV